MTWAPVLEGFATGGSFSVVGVNCMPWSDFTKIQFLAVCTGMFQIKVVKHFYFDEYL